MLKISWIPATAFAVLFPCSAMAIPIVENWTSKKNSYDLHACGSDRFILGERNGDLTSAIAQFTVLPNDLCLKTTGERSEVVLGGWQNTSKFRVIGDEGVEYYRVSVKLPTDWVSPQTNTKGSKWGIFFQLHGPNEFMASPAVAIHAEDKFSLFVLGGDMNKMIGGRRFLTRSALNVGKWVDFVLKIKWAPDATGAISAYRRDEGETVWEKVADIESVPTLQYKEPEGLKPHYWKAGFYRSESKHVNSLWLGPIVRGRTFDDVDGK